MKPYIVAVTGASGVIYGIRLVQALIDMERDVALVVSEQARVVLQEEMGIASQDIVHPENLHRIFGSSASRYITLYSPKDFTAPIASGSYPVEGMAVIPCTMGTLGAIACGTSQNLIHRAADCAIKEGRKLVLVPRETPLNSIHLENMLKLSRLGVSMVAAMPAFYSGEKSVEDMVNFMVGKVLDQLGIVHALYPRWTGKKIEPFTLTENL